MQVVSLLFIAWIVVCGFWLVNHFYYRNQQYEIEYREGKHVRW